MKDRFPPWRFLLLPAVLLPACALLVYLAAMPSRPVPAFHASAEDLALAAILRGHVAAVASREHNMAHPDELEAAARYIEQALSGMGYSAAAQRFVVGGSEVRNIEVEIAGGARRGEILVAGAHYDSVVGSPGANDNGSGVAALLELARLLRGAAPQRTLRLVWFVNEEPPYYHGDDMGSRRYARRSRERGEDVVGMFSLETIGWYSEEKGSQRYPFPLGMIYPAQGNFLGFVTNLRSRALLNESLAAFRRHARFPSEGLAAPAAVPGVSWSDHASFWEQGYPAVMLTDTAPFRYPWYHTANDTPGKVDYPRLARVVAGLHGMLKELAAAP